jgi:endonuclease III
MEEKKEVQKKSYKPVNDEALKKIVEAIVDELYIQSASKEKVNEALKEFKTEYGVKATIIRKVANIVYKRNKEEVEQEQDELMQLLAKVS